MGQSFLLCPRLNPKRKIYTKATQAENMFKHREINVEIEVTERLCGTQKKMGLKNSKDHNIERWRKRP